MGKCKDSDGNRVNVGNFDANGLNVNNNWDDNCNPNIGVAAARNFFLMPIAIGLVRICGINTGSGRKVHNCLLEAKIFIQSMHETHPCCTVSFVSFYGGDPLALPLSNLTPVRLPNTPSKLGV